MRKILQETAHLFMSPPFDPKSRALLYLLKKREDLIVDALSRVVQDLEVNSIPKKEFPVDSEALRSWNLSLKNHKYFGGSGGLKTKKQRGRIDLACLDSKSNPIMLVEVKAWSATDAVDESRYLESKQYNHSLLKSFEIDALKLCAVNSDGKAKLLIITALFTIHCDNMSESQMKRMKLKYIDLLKKQNRDKVGIGNSDAYRIAGVERMMHQFETKFGRGTEMNAKFTHVPVFSRDEAFLDSVGLSLDLIGAELNP